MNEDNFPPLPEPFGSIEVGRRTTEVVFSTDQMREYARLVAAECAKICDAAAVEWCSIAADVCVERIHEKFGLKT